LSTFVISKKLKSSVIIIMLINNLQNPENFPQMAEFLF
jgi:hypothetical protein